MFDASLNLYDAAARLELENTQSFVSDCAEAWSDWKATKTSTKNAINALKNTVSPFLNLATDLAFEPAQSSAPFGEIGHVHQREEQEWKQKAREIVEASPKKTPEDVLIKTTR